MFWLFALGVVVLMVFSPGFRKLGLALLGIGVVLLVIGLIYNESTKDPLSAKRARLATCALALPYGYMQQSPYGGDTYHWNEPQLDRGIQLCEADLATYRDRQKAETDRKLGLATPSN